jgi:putative ABC transport system substrate-binding protein
MRLTRRRLLLAAGALAAPLARAQKRDRLPVLGVLSPHLRPSPRSIADNPFTIRLRELGWIEGRTHLIERAYGEGSEDHMPDLAARLVAKNVDVVIAIGPEAAVAAARAMTTIPIVFWGVPFPVEQGLIGSFAHPGRNATGVAWWASPEIDAKRLQILHEITPQARVVAHVTVPSAGRTVSGREIRFHSFMADAAHALALEVRSFPVLRRADFEAAFTAIVDWGAQALVITGTTLTVREKAPLIAFAHRRQLPAIYTLREFVQAGGLVSYAIDFVPTLARVADYVDLVLRGAKPGELPVDLPTGYELAINLKAAAALGLAIPQSLIVRADRLIE